MSQNSRFRSVNLGLRCYPISSGLEDAMDMWHAVKTSLLLAAIAIDPESIDPESSETDLVWTKQNATPYWIREFGIGYFATLLVAEKCGLGTSSEDGLLVLCRPYVA